MASNLNHWPTAKGCFAREQIGKRCPASRPARKSMHSLFTKPISIVLTAAAVTGAFAGEMEYRRVKRADIPAGVSIEGSYETGIAWKDVNGENLVTFSKSTSREDASQSAALYAVGFKFNQGKPVQAWRVHDWIDECQVDLPAFFEPSSIEVTDLDSNAIGEVSFVYRIACVGGMDYIDEKLFLVENGKKFPIRGATQYLGTSETTQKDIYDGPMKVDKAYNDAPKPFKAFAVDKWQKFKRPRRP